jgi:hypothetical protein
MSRSYRKTPVYAQAGCKSAKWFKRQTHQKNRARLLKYLAHEDYDGAEVDPPYDMWSDPRDGKFYDRDHFDGEELPRYWDRNHEGAFAARKKIFNPKLVKKRRSK